MTVSKWAEFQRRYGAELDGCPESWAPIGAAARSGDVVLLYSSHDAEHNNAVVLRDYVNEKLDQPANEAANAASGHHARARSR